MKAYKKAARRYRKAERIYTKAAKWKFRIFAAGLAFAAWQFIQGIF